MRVEISKDMEYQLEYADFDVEEVKLVLPELFPDAKSIEVTDCEDHWLEALVDEKYYTINNYSFDYKELLDILNEEESDSNVKE